MSTEAIALSHSYALSSQQPAGLETVNTIIDSIEQQAALLEGGIAAIGSKSFRSARYSLIRHLPGTVRNILSYAPPAAWAADLGVYRRRHTQVLYPASNTLKALKEAIVRQQIDLVYISTLHTGRLEVLDYQKLIETAHALQVPVVFDNTHGGLGNTYRPLQDGADYVLTAIPAFSALQKAHIGAFIVEGAQGLGQLSPSHTFVEKPSLSRLKHKRVWHNRQHRLLSVQHSSILAEFEKLSAHSLATSALAKQLAGWLQQQPLLHTVHYPGLDSPRLDSPRLDSPRLDSPGISGKGKGNGLAERYFLKSYGNLLAFQLQDNRLYVLLKGYLLSGRCPGLQLSFHPERQEVVVTVQTDAQAPVLEYFAYIFGHLQADAQFKKAWSMLLKTERKLKESTQKVLLRFQQRTNS